jgi:indolepyruvate ferredoxin oxidoreductase
MAEGANRIAVVTDDPDKYPGIGPLGAGRDYPPPRRLDAVQKELREIEGVRAGLRPDLRRREAPPPQARHLPDPQKRVFINEPSARAAAIAR